jgi:hypothetical protein
MNFCIWKGTVASLLGNYRLLNMCLRHEIKWPDLKIRMKNEVS